MSAQIDRLPTSDTLPPAEGRLVLTDEDAGQHHLSDLPATFFCLEDVRIALFSTRRSLKSTRREKVGDSVLGVSEQWLCYLKMHLEVLRRYFERQRLYYKNRYSSVHRTLTAMNLKLSNGDAKRFYDNRLEPLRLQIVEATQLQAIAIKLHNDAFRQAQPVESRQSRDISVGGSYDPVKGKMFWRYSPSCYVSTVGAYNVEKGEVEWFSSRKGCIAAVWNPHTRVVETRECRKFQSVAGCYNPDRRIVEWKFTKEGKGGTIACVWNPETRCVEWKHIDDVENDIHAAYYDVSVKKVVWDIRPAVKSIVSARPFPLCRFSSTTVWWDGRTYQITQTQSSLPDPALALRSKLP